MTVYCAAGPRRRLIGIADITDKSTAARAMFHPLRLAADRQEPGDHLEVDLHCDGGFVHWWVVAPFQRLPASLEAAIHRSRVELGVAS